MDLVVHAPAQKHMMHATATRTLPEQLHIGVSAIMPSTIRVDS